MRWLTGVFLLGGVGRILSLAVHGQPHWFQPALTVPDLALPAVFFWLAGADEQAHDRRDNEALTSAE